MINLKDYIVEIGDEEYVPLKIAQQAVAEAYQINSQLEEAEKTINNAMSEINNIFKDLNE